MKQRLGPVSSVLIQAGSPILARRWAQGRHRRAGIWSYGDGYCWSLKCPAIWANSCSWLDLPIAGYAPATGICSRLPRGVGRRALSRTRPPFAGATITLRHRARSIRRDAGKTVRVATVARIRVCNSRVASRWPGQRLWPPPHGSQVLGSGAPDKKRSGRNVLGVL
jgi:hypothetical protein